MKKYIKIIVVILIILAIVTTIFILQKNRNTQTQDSTKFKIVTSFYPIYVMTLNITNGAENIELVNMTEANTGCVHDYTLLASDMKKLENADVFIQNGLGLENFMDKVLESNENMQVIDSSKNITNVINEDDEVNPHIWTSISNYINQVQNIAEELISKNSENASIYRQNADEYIQNLTQIKEKYELELEALKGKTAVSLNEAFDYLAKDLGLNVTSIHTSHEESALSAEMLKNVIDTMKQNQTSIIIVDINDDLKNAQIIANEIGAKIYQLDSGLTGNLEKDSYINAIKQNLEKLK